MTTRTITAVYDSETDARHAREQLMSRGLDNDDVRIVSHDLTRNTAGADSDDKGIWESIKDFFVGDEDRAVYDEGMRRGGCLLTARVDDRRTDEVISVLEQTNAVDLDRREQEWRSEGWSAGDTSTTGVSGYSTGSSNLAGGVSARSDTTAGTDEQSIPILQEQLRVGKREVERGGVRIRSYVVEEPVHEQVSLREEHVQVERRPVSDTTRSATDLGFQERTIELNERAEEAVVAKDTVVKEEVVVRKTADERTESIDDTVRHTEVDIDDTTKRGRSSRSTTRGDRKS